MTLSTKGVCYRTVPGEHARNVRIIATLASRLGKANIKYAYVGVDPDTDAPLIFFAATEVEGAAQILEEAVAAAGGGVSWDHTVLRKRHCTNRAQWRLRPAKSAERLSAHYRLGCEYGTSLMTHWKGGGSGPLYVCDDHATALGSRYMQKGLGAGDKE
jgi:hypothetical protein